ncbi:DUF3302 domain-containing protein [Ferrimonas lipolytica]|uniref:DUF3302 domain-containing protein n=1 Tax=Ferrimonas lipolytica TaxID=2724191 RepID=A0A6H1UGP2_9GAMM|nr:DUF3302 domain-containing protein [Ferrimonas lipolytica]QIZ77799.1 DUF3302 domain-containing protein [Ferrimonas lipolytica]
MALDYVALAILVIVVLVLFYGIIIIHDIPYEIAEKRNHPHQDAIHVAGWVSLFTLHTIWPFLWIWATLYREERGWGFKAASNVSQLDSEQSKQIEQLTLQVDQLRVQVEQLQQNQDKEQ